MLGVAGVFALLRGKGRRELADFAAETGFSFVESNRELARRWTGSPFGVGDIRQARNVLTGYQHGRRVVAFDYICRDVGRPALRFGVVVIRLRTGLPRIEVTGRWATDALLELAGTKRVEGESEQFNREFTVLAADQRFGHAMMHPRMMEFLLGHGQLSWRVEGADLLCWAEGRLWPAEVLARAEYLAGIADLVPGFVWTEYGRDPRLG